MIWLFKLWVCYKVKDLKNSESTVGIAIALTKLFNLIFILGELQCLSYHVYGVPELSLCPTMHRHNQKQPKTFVLTLKYILVIWIYLNITLCEISPITHFMYTAFSLIKWNFEFYICWQSGN